MISPQRLLFVVGLCFCTTGLFADEPVLTKPAKPSIELLEEIELLEGAQNTPPVTAPQNSIHQCFGFDLIRVVNTYSPPSMTRIPTQVFYSVNDLQNAINAKTDHGGAILQLAGGHYNLAGNGIDINNRKNLTVYSDPANRAILDSQDAGNFGFIVRQTAQNSTENIEIIGFEITRTRFHAIFVGSDRDGTTAGSDIYIAANYIHNAANTKGAAITIRNATGTGNITIEGNEITRIDVDGSGSSRGEGIYIGEGNNSSHYSQDVTVRGNFVHDMNGEAIDVKRASRNILIEYNKIDNIDVYSQGALTLSLDNLRSQNYNADITVRRNVISNVKTLAKDGNAIVVAGDSVIEENLIFNVAKHAIDIYDDANGPTKKVTLKNNIIWNYVGLPIRENINTGNGGPHDPFLVERDHNIVQSDPDQTDCLVQPGSFVGPLSEKDGFTPKAN